MNLGIIGVGNIGNYHIRDFSNYGFKIVSVVSKNIKFLNRYDNIDDMLETEELNVVSICSPTHTHYSYIIKCLNNNINVFCEKPIIYNLRENNVSRIKKIFEIAENKKLKIGVNLQWVHGIKQLKHLFPKKINSAVIYMEHYKTPKDIDFFSENLCHMNSIIIYLFGNKGKIKDLKYSKDGKYSIMFKYDEISINYILSYPHNKKIYFIINDIKFERSVDDNYNQYFNFSGGKIEIEDPFKLSIEGYIKGKQLINKQDIIRNVALTDKIISMFQT